MAQGNNEHRMVFDIRGRRRHVVKVVYAILAVLMAASLFLVTGAINISSIVGSSSSGESAVSSYEKEAENIEAKLVKEPESEKLLGNLTRARVNTANSMINSSRAESNSGIEEIKQELAQVNEDWSKYVKAAKEPSAGVATLVAPALFQLAELGSSGTEALESVEAAVEAQEIVAEQRPSLNSYSTLAFYTLFTGDYKAAKEALKVATTKYSTTKFERESLENKYEEVESNAKEFASELKEEKESKSSSEGKESLESPLQGLGGGSGVTGE